MHNQPRKPSTPDDAATISKASKLRNLQSQLLHNHHNKIYTKEALEISSKLLELNPEVYTGWNYRKLAVEHYHQAETDPESIKSIINEELKLVEIALWRDFKSYGAWHHRKWIISKGFSSCDHEFKLLDKFQKADPRNFHAWNYRRFIASLKNVPEKEELKYTTDMIEANFSNYSAWHNRSVILSSLLKQKAPGFASKEAVLRGEYAFVSQALFVEPTDQSGWFYHLWLLEQTITPDAPMLVSSWPINGSDLTVSFSSDGSVLPTFTTFHSDSRTFPLILYFNQSVEGVSSSTVKVNFMFCKKDLIWRPLASNNSTKARAWVTYLEYPDTSSEAFPVEVIFGSSYGSPLQLAFTVRYSCTESKSAGGAELKMLNWGDGSFHACEAVGLNLNPTFYSDQPRIRNINASKWVTERLTLEIALFRELLLHEICKIGKLTLAWLLMAHDTIMTYFTPSAYEKVNTEEVLELFSDLMKLDPTHLRYYKDEHSLVLVEKVISKKKSMDSHCFSYGKSSHSNNNNSVCLRLNNMSLSKLGSFEHLLWVQMLDLSHNELQSIEGLEALQILSCLNLSHNKFRSFTALEPLKSLKSLKVLDISYNEIGYHTRRYLCAAAAFPLSHTSSSFNDYGIEIAAAYSWEAILFFEELSLIQLDITGNAVNDENFRLLVFKLLPKLKWLDGEAAVK